MFDIRSQAAPYRVIRMGPETKEHDNDRTDKQTNKHRLFHSLQ